METYVFVLIAFYFTALLKSSIKETNQCLIEKTNLKHELSNIKLYLNIKNISIPEDLFKK